MQPNLSGELEEGNKNENQLLEKRKVWLAATPGEV